MAVIQEVVGSKFLVLVARKENLQHKLTIEPHSLELSKNIYMNESKQENRTVFLIW